MPIDRRAAREPHFSLENDRPVRSTWLSYGRQSISEEDIAAVVAALRSDYLTQGPRIELFEQKVADLCGARHGVAFNSGTAALHSAYFATGIGNGDEIVTSALSFAATANGALYLGATPRFADIELATGNIDPASVELLLTPRTKAIVGVDYAGQPCDADALRKLAVKNRLYLIIDAAHSLGSDYKRLLPGARADVSIFSFHPVKSITTGEGGIAITDDAELARRMRLFRSHGIEKNPERLSINPGPWYHEMQALGHNYRMTDMQAALGISQIDRLQQFVEKRRYIAERYRKRLSGNKHFLLLSEHSSVRSAHHLFPILVKAGSTVRKFVFEALHKENIGVQVHYIPTYHHPYYKQLFGDIWTERCPNTEEFYDKEISLPIFPAMSDEDIDDVLAALDKISSALG